MNGNYLLVAPEGKEDFSFAKLFFLAYEKEKRFRTTERVYLQVSGCSV